MISVKYRVIGLYHKDYFIHQFHPRFIRIEDFIQEILFPESRQLSSSVNILGAYSNIRRRLHTISFIKFSTIIAIIFDKMIALIAKQISAAGPANSRWCIEGCIGYINIQYIPIHAGCIGVYPKLRMIMIMTWCTEMYWRILLSC